MTVSSGRLRLLLLVVVLLLVGFGLRTTDIGSAPLQGDEAWTAFLAFEAGHNQNRPPVGVVSSTGINQPPFFHDVFSIPFFLSPDPRIARLFMAVLHMVGMAVIYRMVARYWSVWAAVVALLLFVVMPHAIWSARALWNPYLMIPFMASYLFTGFLLVEGKRWARWLHPGLLAMAFLSHPSAVVFGPITLLLYGMDWRRNAVGRSRAWLFDHGVGILGAVLLVLPWPLGILITRTPGAEAPLINLRASTDFNHILQWLTLNPTMLDLGSYGLPRAGYTPPAQFLQIILHGIGWLTLLGSLYLVARGVIQRGRYRGAIIGAAYLILPLLLLVLPTRTYDFYFISLLPLAAVIQALVIVDNPWNRHIWLVAKGLLIVGFCVVQVYLIVDAYRQVDLFSDYSKNSMLDLDGMIELRDEAVRSGYETIYLVEGAGYQEFEQALTWQILATNGPSRVIWGDTTTLPVPQSGATYIGYADATHIPEIYRDPEPRFVAHDLYRVVDLPPNSGFSLDCAADVPNRLSNGAAILGYHQLGMPHPQPDTPWSFYLLWQAEPGHSSSDYQMFVHLVDASGDRYAQSDVPVISPTVWAAGDLLVTRLTLTSSDGLPVDDALTLRVGMYTLPDVANAAVLDDQGNPAAAWVTIPVCE